jgi:hypothetical protein
VVLEQRRGDVEDLLGRLAGAVDDLGAAAAQLALRVELSVPEVPDGEGRQTPQRILDVQAAVAECFEDLAQSVLTQIGRRF